MGGDFRVIFARSARGFSILEVLLALALSTALLAGLFSALSLFMRSFDSGRTHVEESQLARALLRQISRDLRAAVVEQASGGVAAEKPLALPKDFLPPADSAAEPMPPGAPLPTTVLSPPRETVELAPHHALRISGTSDRLDLCVRASGAHDSLAALFASTETVSAEPSALAVGAIARPTPGGVCQVSYFCYDSADPDRMLLHQTAGVGDQATNTAGEIAVEQSGLVRREQPWSNDASGENDIGAASTTELAQPESPSGEFGATAPNYGAPTAATSSPRPSEYHQPGEFELEQIDETLTPEVVQVAFRYFDGSAWYSSWDSDSDGGLPVAVDISFWLAEPADEARRPRRADEQRVDAAAAADSPHAAASESTRRSASSSREAGAANAEADPMSGETAEAMPDYRLVVFLPLASPRREEAAYPELSTPDELSSPDELTGPMPPAPMPPAATSPGRSNSIRSFFRPNAPRGQGAAP